MRIGIIFLLVLFIAGCHTMNETLVNVRANIVGLSDKKPQCKLQIISDSNKAVVDWRPINKNIKESFVLPAQNIQYSFVIDCDKYKKYTSKSYLLGKKLPFNYTIDLGEVVMRTD